MKVQLALIVFALLSITSCRTLPERLSQASITDIAYEVSNDSLNFRFSNPLNCPLRISVKTPDPMIQDLIDEDFPAVVDAQSDTLITYSTDKSMEEISIQFSAMMGNPNDSIYKKELSLPFKKGKKYKVIQGYNGSYSHTSEYSKYAIDFNMVEGDTICAAADGFVVGVIEGYTDGGRSKRWKDYANYITIFHPETNLYTQYVHLTYEGSFVEVGDYVKSGQAIGLSGKTGQTDMEHLHFNVLIPNDAGMESTPIEFMEGYKGADLKKGDWVEK